MIRKVILENKISLMNPLHTIKRTYSLFLQEEKQHQVTTIQNMNSDNHAFVVLHLFNTVNYTFDSNDSRNNQKNQGFYRYCKKMDIQIMIALNCIDIHKGY